MVYVRIEVLALFGCGVWSVLFSDQSVKQPGVQEGDQLRLHRGMLNPLQGHSATVHITAGI